MAKLRAYAEANRDLAVQLAMGGGRADVEITFRTYVAPDQFRKWAKEMGLAVRDSEVRYIYGEGNRDFLLVKTDPGDPSNDPLPQTELKYRLGAVNWVQRRVRKIPGVYFTRATVAAQQLPKLATDPLVFLADVTPNVVHNKLLSAGFSAKEWEQTQVDISPDYTNRENERSQTGMISNSPFPRMEDFGLDNFAR